MKEERYYLGVDGGATKTEALITDVNERVLGRGTAGPGNHQTAGIATAKRNILATIQQARRQAKLPR